MTDLITLLIDAIDAATPDDDAEWTARDIAQHVSEVIYEDGWRHVDPAAADILAERLRHTELGYTATHDDEHGWAHLRDIAQGYLAGRLHSRAQLVKAASVILAMIEWQDRHGQTFVMEEEPTG